MKKKHHKSSKIKAVSAALAAGLLASILSAPPAFAQTIGQCIPPAQANAAVQTGTILKLANVLQSAGIGRNATIHNQQVCYVDGELAYIIDVLKNSGATQQLILRGSTGLPYN